MHEVALISSYCSTMKGSKIVTSTGCNWGFSDGEQSAGDNGIKPSDNVACFDAETHLEFFGNVFAIIIMSFDDSVLFLEGGNASVNQKLAMISHKPFVVWYYHRLNLEASSMLKGDPETAETVSSIERTIKSAKN